MTREKYEVHKNEFLIVDPELGIEIRDTLDFLDKDFFPNGAVRYEMYRKEELLHGPSRFYSEGGEVLSETWYIDGKKVGKAIRYYPNGQVYCIERFLDGKPHLMHEYYYLDGKLKTQISYQNGVYHGETKLYWPDGTLKRKCVFTLGKKEKDELYDEQGHLATTLS